MRRPEEINADMGKVNELTQALADTIVSAQPTRSDAAVALLAMLVDLLRIMDYELEDAVSFLAYAWRRGFEHTGGLQ